LQRGASNLYFADVESALDIPAGDDLDEFGEVRLKIESSSYYETLSKTSATDTEVYEYLLNAFSREIDVPTATIKALLAQKAETRPVLTKEGLANAEWAALIAEQKEVRFDSPFITKQTSLLRGDQPSSKLEVNLVEAIKQVVLVTRLKEVRALRSFSRIDPTNRGLRPDLTVDDPAVQRKIDWVPAAEIYGEGIFIRISEDAITSWEQKAAVTKRTELLQRRLLQSSLGASILKQRTGLVEISARFVLLHTFAHLLIRELCFDSGYSAAALRERIYCGTSDDGTKQAGVLIYTAAGDSEGTLGGLVRQGQPPRLIGAIQRAIEAGVWCSADPVCRESHGQGYDKTNLAACHACALLPETSCICNNMLLDRSLFVEAAVQSSAFFPDPATL